MFAPLTLRTKSKFGYVQLTIENIEKLYNMGLISSSLKKEVFLEKVKENPFTIIQVVGDVGVFPNHFLVLQLDNDNNVTGCISFENKEEMLDFFQEAEGEDILPE